MKYALLSGLLLILVACVNETHFGPSNEKKILGFNLENQVGNTAIDQENRLIALTVSAEADITNLRANAISLSTFATVAPAVGAAVDFSNVVSYTVTAEDGTSVTYSVDVTQEGSEPQLENGTFDTWFTTPKGYQEPGADANSIWATGNAGAITLGSANVSAFQVNNNDLAAKLVTADLGGLAGLVNQRMAAGSLYTGKFELDIANPLNSTKFGIAFTARPKKFRVKYAYSPGTPYRSKNGQVLQKTDSCDIYVLLENRDGAEPRRVATGWFRSGEEKTDRFYEITVDLAYGTLSAQVPAYQKPSNGLYATASEKVTHLTVVFSSSYNGALFEGGTNSTLVVNDFQLVYD